MRIRLSRRTKPDAALAVAEADGAHAAAEAPAVQGLDASDGNSAGASALAAPSLAQQEQKRQERNGETVLVGKPVDAAPVDAEAAGALAAAEAPADQGLDASGGASALAAPALAQQERALPDPVAKQAPAQGLPLVPLRVPAGVGSAGAVRAAEAFDDAEGRDGGWVMDDC